MGPLISKEHKEKVEEYIVKALKKVLTLFKMEEIIKFRVTKMDIL